MAGRHELVYHWRGRIASSSIALIGSKFSSISFADLSRFVDQVRRVIEGERVIAVCLDRCPEAIVVVMASILTPGVLFVPVDPAASEQEISRILDETQPDVVFVASTATITCSSRLIVIRIDANSLTMSYQTCASPVTSSSLSFPSDWPADDIMCCMYSSGSTGVPKMVPLTFSGIVNRFKWQWDTYPFTSTSRPSWTTPMVFVDALWQVLGPLLSPVPDVPIVIVEPRVTPDAPRLREYLHFHRVTHLTTVPTVLRALTRHDPLDALVFIASSGEPLELKLALTIRHLYSDALLLNLYGSTEATADSLVFPFSQHTRIPLHSPHDDDLQQYCGFDISPSPSICPIGYAIPGNMIAAHLPEDRPTELLLSGVQVSPIAGPVLHTGDLVLSHGKLIHYCGRISRLSCKLGGNWVNVERIEAVLHSHPLIRRAVVTLSLDHLAAYIVPFGPISINALRGWCVGRLPRVPMFTIANDLPLLPTGKPNVALIGSTSYMVVTIIATQLQVERINPDQDLQCELGVDSITFAGIAARILQSFASIDRFDLVEFDAHRTGRQVADRIDQMCRSVRRPAHPLFPHVEFEWENDCDDLSMPASSPCSPLQTPPSSWVPPPSPIAISCAWSVNMYRCVDSSALVLESSIIIGAHSGMIRCISSRGDIQWATHLPSRIECDCVALDDHRFVVGTRKGHLYCLSSITGEIQWRIKLAGEIRGAPLLISQHSLLVPCYDHHLYGVHIEPSNEHVLWALTFPAALRASPAFANGTIIAACLQGTVRSYRSPDSPRLNWEVLLPSPIFSSPLINGDLVLVTEVSGALTCLDIKSGHALWKFFCASSVFSAPLSSPSLIVVATQNTGIVSLSWCGKHQWTAALPFAFSSSPFQISHRGLIGVCSTTGRLTILSGPDIVGQYQLPGETFATPTCDRHDLIFIGARDDHVHALTLTERPAVEGQAKYIQ